MMSGVTTKSKIFENYCPENIFIFVIIPFLGISLHFRSDRCGSALSLRCTGVVDKKHENLTEQHIRYLTSSHVQCPELSHVARFEIRTMEQVSHHAR